jgi:hypothetical protein
MVLPLIIMVASEINVYSNCNVLLSRDLSTDVYFLTFRGNSCLNVFYIYLFGKIIAWMSSRFFPVCIFCLEAAALVSATRRTRP